MEKLKSRLTDKQLAYCDLRAKYNGQFGGKRRAAIEAGYSYKSAGVQGIKTGKSRHVREYLSAILPRNEKARLIEEGMRSDDLNIRLNYLKFESQIQGEFAETRTVNVNHTVDHNKLIGQIFENDCGVIDAINQA